MLRVSGCLFNTHLVTFMPSPLRLNTNHFLLDLIQLIRIAFSCKGDETAQHVKLVRTGLDGCSRIPTVGIRIIAVPLPEFIFKIEYIGHGPINYDVLTVQKTPA